MTAASGALTAAFGDRPQPAVIDTALGTVELAAHGEGPAVLCLHGAMGGYDQGLILADALGEAGYRYLAPSRPGYLGTPLSRGRSPEAQADLYAAVLDSLGIQRAAVMAVSGGGPSAIHFALRHSHRCWGLVLVSAPAGKVDTRPPLSFTLMQALAHVPWFAASMRRKAEDEPESIARRSIADPALFERSIQDAEAWELLKQLQRSTMDRMTRRFAGTNNDVKVAATRTYPLETVSVPTLVVHGTADPMLPYRQHGQVFAARLPGAELVALEGGGHAAIFSHRNEARQRVTRFLRRGAPRATF